MGLEVVRFRINFFRYNGRGVLIDDRDVSAVWIAESENFFCRQPA
jgi:hypothetical protein